MLGQVTDHFEVPSANSTSRDTLGGMDVHDHAVATMTSRLLTALSGSGGALREWYVKEAVLAPDANEIIPMLAPNILVKAMKGAASTEHAAISSRLLMEVEPTSVVQLPTPYNPASWESPDRVADLILVAWQPWNEIRFDPESENLYHLSVAGQWVSHGKGRPSDSWLHRVVGGYVAALQSLSVMDLMATDTYHKIGDLSTPENVPPDQLLAFLHASGRAFLKFLNGRTTVRILGEALLRSPLMLFDTSTMNTVRGFIPVGSGVIPTEDVIYNGMYGMYPVVKTGMQIPSHPEFVISNAAGIKWPDNERFTEFMEMRASLVDQQTDFDYDEWIEASRVVRQYILETHCPTYHSFLEHAFPADEQQPPVERDAFLRLLAAAIFGRQLKVVAALIGAPNAGKDTIVKWLSYLLGDQVGVIPVSSLTASADDDRGFAPLKGARIAVTSGELGEGRGSSLYADKLKTVTSGGGLLRVAEKYEKPSTIYFDGMLVIQGNSVPTIIGGDRALFSNRLIAVEFKHPFPLTSVSFEAQYRKEAGYFMQALFLAFMEYEWGGGGITGINPPDEWRNFTKEVADQANPYAAIEQAIRFSPESDTPSPQFYAALTLLVRRTIDPDTKMNAHRWAKRLRTLGFDLREGGPIKQCVMRDGYKGRVLHLTVDADSTDAGFFTQQDWQAALTDAAASSRV